MLALAAAATLLRLTYSFPADVVRTYDVKVVFDGFIPILGGQQGRVEVNLGVTAKGLAATKNGEAQVLSELKEMSVDFNGAKLPLTAKNAQDYFPPTTTVFTRLGETIRSNAPDINLPVKLPGLDVKRFPDITYLPVQLPDADIEAGKSWSFKKAFGNSDVVYTVTPTKIEADRVEMSVDLAQSYDVLENEATEVVTKPEDATNSVHTDLKGHGIAVFDLAKRAFRTVTIGADANSTVTELQTKKKSERKLKTELKIALRE